MGNHRKSIEDSSLLMFLVSLSFLISHLSSFLSSSGLWEKKRGREKKEEREGDGTQRGGRREHKGGGRGKKERTKEETHQQVVSPPGGGTLRSSWQSPPSTAHGGTSSAARRTSRRGHASRGRNLENQANPKEGQSWKSVKQNTGKIRLFFAKSVGPYRSWKS